MQDQFGQDVLVDYWWPLEVTGVVMVNTATSNNDQKYYTFATCAILETLVADNGTIFMSEEIKNFIRKNAT